ncbi:MAG: esterase [Gammaproteobacteria bacterium]|nr:esterase [Gammaproteobacteria bacterium]
MRLPVATLICLLAFNAYAQMPARTPTPNDTLQSIEVLDDNRVTLRVYAPKADEVTLVSDFAFQGLAEAGAMQRGEDGVWSITVGPLPADFYSYTFVVDGVRTVDPKNALNKQGVASIESMFLLPGPDADYADQKDVPHGVIQQLWYDSNTLGMQRRLHVYTPPGYDGSTALPVFYLLHGGGDEDSGWSTIGRAGFIMDNLLAQGLARPMIVVMPNGSLPAPAATMPERGTPEFTAFMASQQQRFTDELMQEVVPFVERTLNVRTGQANRALAGLSMGGGQTLRVFTQHPAAFAHVAVWSAGTGETPEQFAAAHAAFIGEVASINRNVRDLEISVGDADFALNGSRALEQVFQTHGLKHRFILTGGGHTWINWRHYLNDYAQKLFR